MILALLTTYQLKCLKELQTFSSSFFPAKFAAKYYKHLLYSKVVSLNEQFFTPEHMFGTGKSLDPNLLLGEPDFRGMRLARTFFFLKFGIFREVNQS